MIFNARPLTSDRKAGYLEQLQGNIMLRDGEAPYQDFFTKGGKGVTR